MSAEATAERIARAVDNSHDHLTAEWWSATVTGPRVLLMVDPDIGATRYYRMTVEEIEEPCA